MTKPAKPSIKVIIWFDVEDMSILDALESLKETKDQISGYASVRRFDVEVPSTNIDLAG